MGEAAERLTLPSTQYLSVRFAICRPVFEPVHRMTPSTEGNSGPTLYEPDSEATYTIEAAADLSGISQRMIVVFCKHGLISPVAEDPGKEGWLFTEEALHTLRRIEHLRASCGANVSGIKLILSLMDEVERLRAVLRFRR